MVSKFFHNKKMNGANALMVEMKKEEIIAYGLAVLQSIGAHHICRVCIENGNSCCRGCEFLEEGIGCQKRNTSCTAWLCGLQKFFLHEIGLLKEWESMWDQVPGQCFRRDETPHMVSVDKLITYKTEDEKIAKLIAEKLEIFVEEGGSIAKLESKLGFDFEMKKINKYHPLYGR